MVFVVVEELDLPFGITFLIMVNEMCDLLLGS